MANLHLESERWVAADPGRVWSTVSDLAGYDRYAAGLRTTEIVSGSELGARRRCTDRSGSAWEETCTVWEPGRRVTMTVDVRTYPLKLRALLRLFSGNWMVTPYDNGSLVTVAFSGTLRRFPGSRWLARSLERRNRSVVESILDRYEEDVAMTSPGTG